MNAEGRDTRPFQENTRLTGHLLSMEQEPVSSGMDRFKSEKECNRLAKHTFELISCSWEIMGLFLEAVPIRQPKVAQWIRGNQLFWSVTHHWKAEPRADLLGQQSRIDGESQTGQQEGHWDKEERRGEVAYTLQLVEAHPSIGWYNQADLWQGKKATWGVKSMGLQNPNSYLLHCH